MTSPATNMTIEQLRTDKAVWEDIINMMNSGISNAVIAAKYGFYPDTTKEAVNSLNIINAELTNRGEIVEGYKQMSYSSGKNILVIGSSLIVLAGMLWILGKITQ